MTKVKKIFMIMLVLWLSCNQVCYADVITTRQILTPISVVAGTISAVVFVMYAICFFIFKSMRNKSQGNEIEREQINLKEESFNNKIYFWVIMLSICLLIFFRMQFRVSLVLLAVPVIAIITSKIFRKKDNIKIISITIMLISIVLIGIYCYYIYAYNNQFLKHSQYINGIRTMERQTNDLHELIKVAIENNKKTLSKKIVVKCVLRENKFGINFTNKRSEKSYTTVQELEWLLDNINLNTSTIDFEYDENFQFIKCIEIFVSIPKNYDEEDFFEYIVQFYNNDARVDDIKYFFSKAREKYNELLEKKKNEIIEVEGKTLKIVYVVNNRDEITVESFEEEDINKILSQLSEENIYRLLVQSYNEYFKISIMHHTR